MITSSISFVYFVIKFLRYLVSYFILLFLRKRITALPERDLLLQRKKWCLYIPSRSHVVISSYFLLMNSFIMPPL
jgi:hypothetical protein